MLGSATEGVGLITLKTSICEAYKGPAESYPQECAALAGPQKNFAVDSAAAPENRLAKPDPKVNVGENNMEAPEQQQPAAVNGAVTTGKTRMEMYWRAFW